MSVLAVTDSPSLRYSRQRSEDRWASRTLSWCRESRKAGTQPMQARRQRVRSIERNSDTTTVSSLLSSRVAHSAHQVCLLHRSTSAQICCQGVHVAGVTLLDSQTFSRHCRKTETDWPQRTWNCLNSKMVHQSSLPSSAGCSTTGFTATFHRTRLENSASRC